MYRIFLVSYLSIENSLCYTRIEDRNLREIMSKIKYFFATFLNFTYLNIVGGNGICSLWEQSCYWKTGKFRSLFVYINNRTQYKSINIIIYLQSCGRINVTMFYISGFLNRGQPCVNDSHIKEVMKTSTNEK